MVDRVSESQITGGAAAPVSGSGRTAKPTGSASFAEALSAHSSVKRKQAEAPKAPAGEKTEAVEGHSYQAIVSGPRNGMQLNKSGNARDGQAFMIVEREGRRFHVYGSGADRQVFEIKVGGKDASGAKPPTPSP